MHARRRSQHQRETIGLGHSHLILLDRKEKLELWGQFLFGVQPVGEVDTPDPAIRMDLAPQGLDVVRPVGTTGEVGEVELDLVPALVQTHGHRADEGLHASGTLIVGGPEAPTNVLVVQHHHLEGEVFLQVLDDHHEEGKFDAEGLRGVHRTRNVVRAHVSSHNLQHARLDVRIGESFNVPIPDVFVPDLQRLAPNAVENRKEPRLKGVLEHLHTRARSV
jgi:hypothetical protein